MENAVELQLISSRVDYVQATFFRLFSEAARKAEATVKRLEDPSKIAA